MALSRIVLIAAVALFLVYVAIQVRPRAQKRRELQRSIKAARDRAHGATAPEDKAAALGEAGEAAARARRFDAAEGFFSRAMRHAPSSVALVRRAAESLRARPRVAERVLQRRLASLTNEASLEGTQDARVALAGSLAELYEGPLSDRQQAQVMRRLEALERRDGDR